MEAVKIVHQLKLKLFLGDHWAWLFAQLGALIYSACLDITFAFFLAFFFCAKLKKK